MNMAQMQAIQEVNRRFREMHYLSVSWRIVSYPFSQASKQWSAEFTAWGQRDLHPQIEVVSEHDDLGACLDELVTAVQARLRAMREPVGGCEDCERLKRPCAAHFLRGFR